MGNAGRDILLFFFLNILYLFLFLRAYLRIHGFFLGHLYLYFKSVADTPNSFNVLWL